MTQDFLVTLARPEPLMLASHGRQGFIAKAPPTQEQFRDVGLSGKNELDLPSCIFPPIDSDRRLVSVPLMYGYQTEDVVLEPVLEGGVRTFHSGVGGAGRGLETVLLLQLAALGTVSFAARFFSHSQCVHVGFWSLLESGEWSISWQ